ncbi:MAG: transaldolase [Saprospiraceae bacterium]
MNKQTKELHNQGISLWLDNITRKMLDDGTIQRYITEFSVTGLTSNPTIFDHAIANSNDYDTAIKASGSEISDEDLFFKLAVEDIQRAADLFLPVYEKTNGLDGFVSIEVSPLLAFDTENTIKAAKKIFALVNRPNAFIKIPGTPEGLPAIEKAIAEGIPVNVTLLFTPEQYIAAAEAYLKGIEKRIEKGLKADIRSVASVFVSRWDRAVTGRVGPDLENKLGLTIMQKVYAAYLGFLNSERVRQVMNTGVFPQRLLWASTGTKDPAVSDTLYVAKLAAPYTVNTMPENTLLAFGDHGEPAILMKEKVGEAANILEQFKKEGVEYLQLGLQLQNEGAASFKKSWEHLIDSIKTKRNKI